MNLKILFDKIKEYSHDADPNVGDVFYGDIYQLNHIQTVEYPAVIVTSAQHSADINNDYIFSFRVNIFYVERLLDNHANKIDIHANGINFLNSLLNHLADEFIINNYEIQCFNERFNDMCAGAYANVMIRIPIDQCYEVIDADKEYEKYLDGWIFGKRLNSLGEIDDPNSVITAYYDAPAETYVTYYLPEGAGADIYRGIWAYGSEGQGGRFLGWASRGTGEFNFRMPAFYTKFRMSFNKDFVDDIYIKNKDGIYIFKGKNVE